MPSDRPRARLSQLADQVTPHCSRCRESLAEEVYTFQVIAAACKAGVLCANCTSWFLDQLRLANDQVVNELEAQWELETGEA